ncbi:MAG: hypothetical protein N6V41_01770 [Candidatus Portiera aleyrodidarum]|nr:hypothetical protein [Candidatus Portiera aleyrodidarum]
MGLVLRVNVPPVLEQKIEVSIVAWNTTIMKEPKKKKKKKKKKKN